MARIVCVGEGMVELSRDRGGEWRTGFGGDTLNCAIHFARQGHDVAYMTALGNDEASAGLRAHWRAEGLDVSLVLTHPTRTVGRYAIETDDAGERTFAYWRDESAARELFGTPGIDAALEAAGQADLLFFSLISLAILPPEGRTALLALAGRVRANGGRVAFDGNYRARLWQDEAEARTARDKAIAVADIGLPTLEDEDLPDAEAVAAHWQGLGCAETVVKLGAHGCRLPDGTPVAPPATLSPVDTSGAGDAFDAGYLAARLRGAGPAEAALRGHAVAGWTIMRPGAIPPRDPSYPS